MSNPLRPSAREALAEWARRVRANREQVDRVREVGDGSDFYAPVAARFQADPHRHDDPTLEILRPMVQPGETWLDIGAGGGRYALPIALVAREVIALDPSAGMLAVLANAITTYQVPNVRIVEARWPLSELPDELARIDVALIAHVGYDVEEIGPFLDAMEATASSRCVAILLEKPPASDADELWPEVHGEARASLPSLPEFLTLQLARGRLYEVRLVLRGPSPSLDPEQAQALARRLTWVRPGSPKDRRLEQLVRARQVQSARIDPPSRIGIVSWTTPKDEPMPFRQCTM